MNAKWVVFPVISVSLFFLFIGLLALMFSEDVPSSMPAPPVNSHDSLGISYTYDGDDIRWYVFTDPDTGVEYLFNDRGGCVERADNE